MAKKKNKKKWQKAETPDLFCAATYIAMQDMEDLHVKAEKIWELFDEAKVDLAELLTFYIQNGDLHPICPKCNNEESLFESSSNILLLMESLGKGAKYLYDAGLGSEEVGDILCTVADNASEKRYGYGD